jgi:hypothetical protein
VRVLMVRRWVRRPMELRGYIAYIDAVEVYRVYRC